MSPRRPTTLLIALVLAITTAACFGDSDDGSDGRANSTDSTSPAGHDVGAADDVIQRACNMPAKFLLRIHRGTYNPRSTEITMVPRYPNFSGAFTLPGHSGPWTYLQNVPLVLYGPQRINAAGSIERHAGIVDVFPTVGELLGLDFPERSGAVLTEAVREDPTDTPKLIVTVIWDGVGRNVLNRWPDRWPNLKRLESEGTSYVNATVGSSPSVTPATHSNLGTGAFPRQHGVPALVYRREDDTITATFLNRDASLLKLTTYAHEIDLAYDNKSEVGLLGWTAWHLGVLGHGDELPGADQDQFALIGHADGDISGNPANYEMPSYFDNFLGLRERWAEVDRADGQADGRWLGHGLSGSHDNPAWVYYERDALLEMLQQEGYGQDETPDVLLTNFKITDIIGHQYTMDSQEMAEVLEATDAALGDLLEYLDEEVRDYVLILTADHGHTPSAERTGAWAIGNSLLRQDVDDHFDVPEGRVLVQRSVATGLFLNEPLMAELGITAEDVARFLNGYTIRENWEGDLPPGYEDRGDEKVFSSVFPTADLPEIMECAFGSKQPPPDLEG